jgi:hypothetical protein
MAAQRIDSLFCNFPTPFFSGFWSFCGAGKFYQNGVPRRQLTGTAPFFWKIGPRAMDREHHAKWLQAIDLLFCHFPTPFFPDFDHFAEP